MELITAVSDNDINLVKRLIDTGVDINIVNSKGKNAYFIACELNHREIADLLISKNPALKEQKIDGQQCLFDDIKDPELDIKSVSIKKQLNGDCFAHAIARNFVRTLQMLGAFTSKHNEYFYKLFYTIIVNKFGCTGLIIILTALTYLLEYLYNNLESLFETDMCIGDICNMYDREIFSINDDVKSIFKQTMIDIKPALYILSLEYKIEQINNNNPSRQIKEMLDEKLQPVVGFTVSEFLLDKISSQKTKSNLVPSITENRIYSCNKGKNNIISRHAINLRKWMRNYIEFKNSWGTGSYNSGNFSITDIKLLTCINYDIISIDCLMFNKSLLSARIIQINENIKSKYKTTIDKEIAEFNIKLNIKYVINDFNIISGTGILKFGNNNIYEGEFKNNMYNGRGRMIIQNSLKLNGSTYDGEWIDNKKNGFGIITYTNGNRYEGEWNYDKINGKGKMTYNNGDIYEGDWENDKKNGRGTITYGNGEIYEGEWKNDKRNGFGKMTYKNGEIYEGAWKNDLINGIGKMIYTNSDVYEGEFKDYTNNDDFFEGYIYEGDLNSKKDGQGKMTYGDGTVYEGLWKDDIPINKK